ncbi:MAG: hypothetical protein ACI4J7_04685 [Ruminiclostridium sp.]
MRDPINNIKGQRFGKLTAVEFLGKSLWRCVCDCGNERNFTYYYLTNGRYTSCGCDKEQKKNIKICKICGKEFYAPPSSKKICCSKECSAKNKSNTHKGLPRSEEWRRKLAAKSKLRDMTALQVIGTEAAKASPKCGRFSTNKCAKDWVLYSPDGVIYQCTNLLEWARNNVELFGFDSADRENIDYYAKCIGNGFGIVKRNIKKGYGTITYKDWTLYGWDDATNAEKWWRTPVSPQLPLKFDVMRLYSPEFARAICNLVADVGPEDIMNKTGISERRVQDWKNGQLPNLNNLIALYKNYGVQVLPLIDKNGMLVRKEPIEARGSSIITRMCAEAGYTIREIATAMRLPVPVFHNRYSTSGTQARGAIELLYLFGIETIIRYYDE